jgi:cyclophilin family peptidyl-prolyl cis-trans isomerase
MFKGHALKVFLTTVAFALAFAIFAGDNSFAAKKKPVGKKVPNLEQMSKDYILFHTQAGDIVFGLFPEAAPRHVEQILKLVRVGAYDGTHVFRIAKGFVAQISSVQDRLSPLRPEQEAVIKKLPGEFTALRHSYGMLSMARDEDPDSAESSFSMMLGEAPHLDGKYTIFGRVVEGAGVLDELLKVPVNTDDTPKARITINRAEVIRAPFPPLNPVQRLAGLVYPEETTSTTPLLWSVFGLGLGLVLISGMAFIFRKKLSSAQLASFHAITYLIATFLAVLSGLQLQLDLKWFGMILFIMMIIAFVVVSRFESGAGSRVSKT